MVDEFKPDQDMIDRYVQERLEGKELERMELWLLRNPHRLEEVRLADALRRGIKEIGPDAGRGRNGVAVRGFLGWLARPAAATVAAALVLAVLIAPGWAYLEQRDAYLALSRPTLWQLYPIEAPRGATSQDPDIVINLAPDPYTVVLELPIPAGSSQHDLDVAIRRAGETPHIIEGGAIAKSVGKIPLAFNTSTLSPGLLEVDVSSNEGKLATYRIRVQEH